MNLMIKTLCITTLLLSGCDEVANTNFGEGKVSVSIKDAPVDGSTQVVLTLTGIELKPYNGNAVTIDFDTPILIDLLDYQGATSKLLVDSKTVTGGSYSWLRLKVDESNSYLVNGISPGTHPLTIPSGSETGLKLVSGFTVPQDGSIALTVDFDLRHSIVESGGDYKLKPVLRLIENDKAGHINGTIPSSMVRATGCGTSAVYLYEGSNVTADDLDGKDADPIDSSLVKPNGSTHEYEFGFHEAGNYTIAFTCQANLDNSETDDATVTFSNTANVTVTAGATTTHNF
jgi:hypothetical protein